MKPQYPVYVPSKGRSSACQTVVMLEKDSVDYYLVVEPSEKDLYGKRFGYEKLLVLPWNGNDEVRQKYCADLGIENGGLIAVRNWIKQHSLGAKRHWQLDDNMESAYRNYKGKRIRCNVGTALRVTEDFVDRYENVALAGLAYTMFVINKQMPPFYLNVHVYSCSLILNSIPYKWRSIYNDDTDLCLQVLSNGWCTVLMNAFAINKLRTETIQGGNTGDLYKGDGRLRMARSLERLWPGVVETKRRYGRPQHVIKKQWMAFDNKLIRRTDIDWDKIKESTYDIKLNKLKEIKSQNLSNLYETYVKTS